MILILCKYHWGLFFIKFHISVVEESKKSCRRLLNTFSKNLTVKNAKFNTALKWWTRRKKKEIWKTLRTMFVVEMKVEF